MKFSERFRDRVSPALIPHLAQFESITANLARENTRMVLWQPPENPRALVKHYLDTLLMVYTNKFYLLCQALIQTMNSDNFFVYGLIGRSLIEHTAILRYYTHEKMQPLLQDIPADEEIPPETVQELITLLNRHLTGHRFDWDTFLRDYFDEFEGVRSGRLPPESQVNIITCLEKWARQNPAIANLYALFCDLVHPNLGSTLLVGRRLDRHISIGGQQGQWVGLEIFQRTFPDLLALSREVDERLAQLQAFQQRFPEKAN